MLQDQFSDVRLSSGRNNSRDLFGGLIIGYHTNAIFMIEKLFPNSLGTKNSICAQTIDETYFDVK